MPNDREPQSQSDEKKSNENERLEHLLQDIRILIPGTEVLAGFLLSLPFTERFHQIAMPLRYVFFSTLFAAFISLVLFTAPAAYHRRAGKIHNKAGFIRLANRLVVAGLVPLSIAVVLAVYLASWFVLHELAWIPSAVIFVLIVVLWWVVPTARVHDQVERE